MTRQATPSRSSAVLAKSRGVGLFGLSVILSGSVSLITIPAIVAVAGADAWASMATGQSIGASFAVVTVFGWGLTGPAMIAQASAGSRPSLFLDSLFARLTLLIPVLIVQAVVTLAIVPEAKLVAFVAGAAMTFAGASANWYFTGESRPDRFLLLDTVPRVAGTLLGVGALIGTGELIAFAACQLAGSIVALGVSCIVIFRGQPLDVRRAARWSRIRRSLFEQRHGVVATGIHAASIPAALAIIAIFLPRLLPMFIVAERVGKFAAMAVSPLMQMFQGWVPAASGTELVRRMRVAGLISAGTAIAAGGVYAALLPWFSDVLTHGSVTISTVVAVAFGVNLMTGVFSPYLTTVGLMTFGQSRTIALSFSAGVAVTLIALVSVHQLAPEIAVWALVTGNVMVTCWQGLALRREVRSIDLASTAPHPPEMLLAPVR